MPKRRTDVAQKALRATARKAAPPPAAAAAPVPPRPAALRGRAARIWDTYAPELVASGMLTGRDVPMFSLWCRLAVKAEDGELSGGALTQFRLIGNDYGMSPSGKGRELAPGVPPNKPHKFFGD